MKRKYVECEHCGRVIYVGKSAFVHRGYIGVFCSAECCLSRYYPKVKQINLTEDLAEDQETEIYETDFESGVVYPC